MATQAALGRGSADRLVDVPDVHDVVAVDPTEFRQKASAVRVFGQWRDLDVGRHAAHRNGHAENATDAILQNGAAPLRDILEEGLGLREPERDHGTFNADGTAGQDERLGRRVLADYIHDLGPALQQQLKGRPGSRPRPGDGGRGRGSG